MPLKINNTPFGVNSEKKAQTFDVDGPLGNGATTRDHVIC